MKINVNLYPKEGFFFKDADGVIHRASSWKGVISRLTNYRSRSGMAPGDPESEVMAQACARNPALCCQPNPERDYKLKLASLKGKVLSWLSAIAREKAKEPLQFVRESEAAERRNVCATCPNNQPLAEGCSACKAAVREMRRGLLGQRPIYETLNGCLALGQDNAVAVHLNEQRVENPELPQHCWKKRGGA